MQAPCDEDILAGGLPMRQVSLVVGHCNQYSNISIDVHDQVGFSRIGFSLSAFRRTPQKSKPDRLKPVLLEAEESWLHHHRNRWGYG